MPPPSSRHASTRRCEVLAGLERPDAEDVRRAKIGTLALAAELRARRRDAATTSRSALDPERRRHIVGRVPGVGEDHVAGADGVRRTSGGASRSCAVVHHSGWWTGSRSWMIVARSPDRCGGVIQSVKRSASNEPSRRSAAGCPSLLQAVRTACEAGSGQSLVETGIPASARRIRAGPFRLVGANATISCSSPAASDKPRERAADVVPDPGRRVRERRDVERDSHGS